MTSVLFGDIEATLVSYLDTVLTPPVRTKVPNPRPSSCVIVQRLGGTKATVVSERPLVTFEAWANTDQAAHDLAQLTRRAVHDLPPQIVDGIAFYRVDEVGGPHRLPDPTSAQPRFVFTVSMTVRALTSS